LYPVMNPANISRLKKPFLAATTALIMLLSSFLSDINPTLSSMVFHQPRTLAQMEQLVNPADPNVKKTLKNILDKTSPTSPLTDFNSIRQWVFDNIEHVSDEESQGVSDYWQTPSETLSLRTGDCEDFAILLCSLLRANGVPADQVYVAVGYDAYDYWHAFIVEKYYFEGIWRSIDAEVGDGAAFLDSEGETTYSIDYCFNDKSSFNGPPFTLSEGIYRFQSGTSYFPWERGYSSLYRRELKAREKVATKVEWLPESGNSTYNSLVLYPWSFNIFYQDGSQVFSWSGTDRKHEFNFEAGAAREYYLEILKRDTLPRVVQLTVAPKDWEVATAEGFTLPTENDLLYDGALSSYIPDNLPQVSHNPPSAELIQHALDLINQNRQNPLGTKVAPVTLGTNSAAQAHAEDMLDNGFFSHWGSDGTNSDLRYTLAGGSGYASENIYVTRMDWTGGTDAQFRQYLYTLLDEAEVKLMENVYDRHAIRNSLYTKVTIGIAYNDSYFFLVQLFESGSHSTIDGSMSINNGTLSFSGQFSPGYHPIIDSLWIYYTPLPQLLSPNQLNNARDLSFLGRRMISIVYPKSSSPNPYWEFLLQTMPETVNPYKIPLDAPYPAPDSDGGIITATTPVEIEGKFIYIEASKFVNGAASLVIEANLRPLFSRFGPGIYTVQLTLQTVYESSASSEGIQYSLFVR
jgi:predicted transglutaminase-like cysteine proteinase